jgi:hypothetical protein
MIKRKTLTIVLVFSLIAVVIAAGADSAFAKKPKTEAYNVEQIIGAALCFIPVQNGPPVFMLAQHFGYSNFYEGKADRINILMVPPDFSVLASAYEDNPTRYEFSTEAAGSGDQRYLVNRNVIQIRNVGKDVFVSWEIPLTATNDGVTVTIPPGSIELQGQGDPQVGGELEGLTYPSGWTARSVTTGYFAQATMNCPEWGYQDLALPFAAVTVDGIMTWTPPSD